VNIFSFASYILQRRGERRATINEEVGGVYDVNVLYRGYVQLTNTKNSKTNVYTFVLHRARLKSIMHSVRKNKYYLNIQILGAS